MTAEQKKHIRDLVKKYSGNCGTETLIGFVADSSGMLEACRLLLTKIDGADSNNAEWLRRECFQYKVVLHSFLQEVSKIVALFQPTHKTDDHYATLGVPVNADFDEIKQAYRALSKRYHPDTASSEDAKDSGKFISITKAYHALVDSETSYIQKQHFEQRNDHLPRKKSFRVSSQQRKNIVLLGLGLLAVLLVVSIVGSINIRKKAMLAGLQESRGAFVPPVTKPSVGQEGAAQLFKGSYVESKAVKQEMAYSVGNMRENREPNPEAKNSTVSSVTGKPEEQIFSEEIHVASVKEGPHKKILIVQHPEPEQEPVQSQQQEEKAPISPPPEPSIIESVQSGETTEVVAAVDKLEGKEVTTAEELVPPEKIIAAVNADTPNSTLVDKVTEPSSATKMDANEDRQKNIQEGTQVKSEVQPMKTIAISQLPKTEMHEGKEDADKNPLQYKIYDFLERYSDAYAQRKMVLFARFFTEDAMENGKPFSAIASTYLDLFASTSDLDLKVFNTSWQQDNETIQVHGTFTVFIKYNDSRRLSGSGNIEFILNESSNSFLISRLDYDFQGDK